MNGDAAVAALRAHEAAQALPRSLVLACTGNSSPQDVERFEHAGFDGVLTKPLDLNALVPALAALVADRSATVDGIAMFANAEAAT
jgi:CheY-like chemotaxis protein